MLCKVVTFNLHGLNNGKDMLYQICDDDDVLIVAVQEHWLTNDKLHLLNGIHPDFIAFGVSGMSKRIASEIYVGRPFGGVAFLCRKSVSNKISVIGADDNGRCICLSLKLCEVSLRIFSVYFPCRDSTAEYEIELSSCIGFIDNHINIGSDTETIILGDTNFDCSLSNLGFRSCNNVLMNYGIRCCDDLILGSPVEKYTYFNESLNHFSCIDHFFMSDKLRRSIVAINVVDSGINLSDHRPLIATLSLRYEVDSMLVKSHKAKHVTYSWRWDKADLYQYECQTRANLAHAILPVDCLSCTGCTNECHLSAINNYYNEIVTALQDAASMSIPRIPTCSLKPYWNDEIERLKEDCIFWHNLWVSAGRPSGGHLMHHIKSSCKLKYKLAIKDAYTSYENSLDDELLKFYIRINKCLNFGKYGMPNLNEVFRIKSTLLVVKVMSI